MRLFRNLPRWLDYRLSICSVNSSEIELDLTINDFWKKYHPTENWLAELAHFFKITVPDGPDEALLLKDLMRHINDETSVGQEITKNFKIIYAILTKKVRANEVGFQFDVDNEAVVAGTVRTLMEGLATCSQGVFERAKTICDRWSSPISLSGFLKDYRTEIVESLARANFKRQGILSSMETHRVNFYKDVALAMHFTVHGTVKEEYYKKAEDRECIQRIIADAIEKSYTPLGIVKYIEDRLRGLVFESSAPNKEANETRQQYLMKLHDHNDTHKKILESLFFALGLSMPSEINNYFLTERRIISRTPPEAFVVYKEINWEQIRELIIQSLGRYGIITAQENRKKLLQPLANHTEHLIYWFDHIASDVDIKAFFNTLFFGGESQENRRQLLLAVCSSEKRLDRLKQLLGDQDFFDQLNSLEKDELNLEKKYLLKFMQCYYFFKNNDAKYKEVLRGILSKDLAKESNRHCFFLAISQVNIEIRGFIARSVVRQTHGPIENPQNRLLFLPKLLNYAVNSDSALQKEIVLRTYKETTLNGVYESHKDTLWDIRCFVDVLVSLETDELKDLFLFPRLGNRDEEIVFKIVTCFRKGATDIDKNAIPKCLTLFHHLPKHLKIPVLTALNDSKLFAWRDDSILSALLIDASHVVMLLQGFDIKSIEEITANPRLILSCRSFDTQTERFFEEGENIWESLQTPIARVAYLRNLQQQKCKLFDAIKKLLIEQYKFFEIAIEAIITDRDRALIKPFVDLIGGIEPYAVSSQFNIHKLIKILKLLPEYAKPLMASIRGMNHFFSLVEVSMLITTEPNLLVDVLESLPDDLRNEFLTHNNNTGMTFVVDQLFRYNNFATFFPNILNTLSDDQKIRLVTVIAERCFEKDESFLHFDELDRFLNIITKLPSSAIRMILEKGGARIADFFAAMMIDQQLKFLRLLNHDDRLKFYASISDTNIQAFFDTATKENLHTLLPLIPFNILERYSVNIQNVISRGILTLAEMIAILQTHNPPLSLAQIIRLFLLPEERALQTEVNSSNLLSFFNIVDRQPHQLTFMLPLLPRPLAEQWVDILVGQKVDRGQLEVHSISMWFKENKLSASGQPCRDLSILCGFTSNRKKLIDTCGSLPVICQQAYAVDDLTAFINAITPQDYPENCILNETLNRLIVNRERFFQLFSQTNTIHYPLLLRSISSHPQRYLQSIDDLVAFFHAIKHPNKHRALITQESVLRDHIGKLLQKATIQELANVVAAFCNDMPHEKIKLIALSGGFHERFNNIHELHSVLFQLPIFIRSSWMQEYIMTEQERNFVRFESIRERVRMAMPAHELAHYLNMCASDEEKDAYIKSVKIETIAVSITDQQELTTLLAAFPNDPHYEIVSRPADMHDPTDPNSYETGKIYLYMAENELRYSVLSRDRKELFDDVLDLDVELPQDITPAFVQTLSLTAVLHQTAANGHTLNANKAQLIDMQTVMDKANIAALPSVLRVESAAPVVVASPANFFASLSRKQPDQSAIQTNAYSDKTSHKK